MVDKANEARIKHIIYTSGVRKDESDTSPIAVIVGSRIKTENFIKASGITYIILRRNLYAEVMHMLIGDINQLLKTKSIFLPTANGLSSFVPKNDFAEAAVNIILNLSAYANKILEFNGSEHISFSEIANKISEIMKEPIQYISPEIFEFETTMHKFGLPNHNIKILTTFSLAIAQGEFDQQSNDLETILGRKTKPLSEFLKEPYK